MTKKIIIAAVVAVGVIGSWAEPNGAIRKGEALDDMPLLVDSLPEPVPQEIDVQQEEPPLITEQPLTEIQETETPLAPVAAFTGEVRGYYDELKDDDYIVEPYYYGYSYHLTGEERDLAERIVMHEAGWCPDYRLLILTAQCVRNDCELNNWRMPETFDKCGYAAMEYANPRAVKAVHDVFDEGIECVPEKIFCYYNSTMVSSPMHEENNLAIDIDGNRFFY